MIRRTATVDVSVHDGASESAGTDTTASPPRSRAAAPAFSVKRLRFLAGLGGLAGLTVLVLWLVTTIGQPAGRLNVLLSATDQHQLLHAAVAAAARAGKVIVDLRDDPEVTAGGRGEPVTIADKQSNDILTAINVGSAAVVSEEGVSAGSVPAVRRASDLVLWIDPLDATQEYTERLTQYVSIQMCFSQCGRVVASVLHFPFTGITYLYMPTAAAGPVLRYQSSMDAVNAFRTSLVVGAMADRRFENLPCTCPPPSPAKAGEADSGGSPAALLSATVDRALAQWSLLSPAQRTAAAERAFPAVERPLRVVITRSHLRNETRSATGSLSLRSAVAVLEQRYPGTVVTRAGGAGYKLAGILEGKHDLYIHDGPIRQWDVCAGGSLVRAAGGAVSDWVAEQHDFCVPAAPGGGAGGGQKSSFAVRGIVAAANPLLHAFAVAVINGALGAPD